jgi:hypothetical protein
VKDGDHCDRLGLDDVVDRKGEASQVEAPGFAVIRRTSQGVAFDLRECGFHAARKLRPEALALDLEMSDRFENFETHSPTDE